MNVALFARISVLLGLAAVPLFAGTYGPQTYDSFAVNATNLGDGSELVNASAGITSIQNRPGSATNRAVRLTSVTLGSNYGAFKLPVIDPSGEITAFDVTFRVMQYNTGNIADGFTFNFGAIPAGSDPGAGESGFSMPNGLFIAFDTYANFAGDAPRIRAYANSIQIGNSWPAPFGLGDQTFHTVVIHWDGDGLDMTYDGATVFSNQQLPGFVPAQGNRFAFSGRTGGVTQDTLIDDLQITTSTAAPLTTGNVVITEFVADNGDGIQDEDNDASDWIELYNGTNAAVNLSGWRLTNVSTNLGLWTFPAVNLPAYTYMRVFASAKNRVNPAGVLHTNFTLPKEGGYLALVKFDGTTKTSEFNYTQQSEDVSFGTYGAAQTQQFLAPPTPVGKNEATSVSHADGRPAEEVIFSREGGLITGAVQLGVTAPLAQGAVIRYTQDGTVPLETSPTFDPAVPLTISTTRNIRARVFQPGRLPGDVSSRTFLQLDTSLTSYGTTGQPFRSNLPIIVVESFGTNVDAVFNPAGGRPYRPVYTVVLGKDPANGSLASVTGLVDFQGRGGMHVRGQTSASFPQKPYAWEIWTNEDDDKSVPLLGMPSEADWVLQTAYNDKTLMRNILPYTLMNEINGPSAAVRSQFVEVFFNQDGGPISYADYRGVYVLMERIERGSDRIDLAKLNPLATDPVSITGGYIFKKDKLPVSPMYNTTSTGGWGGQTHEIVEPEDASAAQVAWLQSHVQAFDNALSGGSFTDPNVGYKAYIEPQTFIDNHLWVEVFKQIDGYRLSTYWTKDRGQKIRAFPIWDYNLSGGNANYLTGEQPAGWYYAAGLGAGDYPYYPRLFQDADFRAKYWDRYWKFRQTIFATANIHARIDAWANQLTNNTYQTNVVNGASIATGGGDFYPTDKGNNLSPSSEGRIENPIMRQFDRWPILGVYVWPNASGYASRTTFQSEVQWMKTWFTDRLNWIDTQSQGGRPPTFSSYGGNVPSGTQLTMTNPNGTGTIYYTTDGSDPNVPALFPIVPEGATLRWLVPSAANGGDLLTAGAGANQWTNYTDPPNLAGWGTATGGVGFDDTVSPVDFSPHFDTVNGDTRLQMFGINQTCYIRVNFTIPDQATLNSINTLIFSAKYDEGFRVYVNGVNSGGRNDGHASMTSNPATAQSQANHLDSAAIVYENVDITALGKPALRVGTNVLAIHALNLGLSNTEFLMAPKLSYTRGGTSYTGPITLLSTATVKARVLIGATWSPLTEAPFVVNAQPASSANLVVSEFSYDPLASGANSSKDLEFITLRNISAGNVDLTGVQLITGAVLPLTGTPQSLTLPPGGEAILAANPTALLAVHGAPPAGVTVFGPFDGTLDNSGEMLSIRTVSGAVIKEFTYSPEAPWPGGISTSLVLQNPSLNPDHNDPYNWRSGTTTRGTPWSDDSVAFTGSWLADTDNDGYSDGTEYKLGTLANNGLSIPQISVTVGQETVEPGPVTGKFLRLTFRRRLANDQGAIVPELSANLTDWQSGAAAFNRVAQTNNGDGTVTETWRTNAPVGDTKAFARLKLVSP